VGQYFLPRQTDDRLLDAIDDRCERFDHNEEGIVVARAAFDNCPSLDDIFITNDEHYSEDKYTVFQKEDKSIDRIERTQIHSADDFNAPNVESSEEWQ
jgi:hypothetical protein